MFKPISISLFILLFISCANETTNYNKTTSSIDDIEVSKSQNILNQSITAHGGDLYNSAHYSFIFRRNTYEFKHIEKGYIYKKTFIKDNSTSIDILTNGDFNRKLNGDLINLSAKESEAASEAINSVMYFATLPYKLNDKAVNTIYIDSTTIKAQNYDVIEITFDQAGGGEDLCYRANPFACV
jgi:hypothetical protein